MASEENIKLYGTQQNRKNKSNLIINIKMT